MNYRTGESFFFGLQLSKKHYEKIVDRIINECDLDYDNMKRAIVAFVKFSLLLKPDSIQEFIKNYKNVGLHSKITNRQIDFGEITVINNYYPIEFKENIDYLIKKLSHLITFRKKNTYITSAYIRWMLLNDKVVNEFIEWFKVYKLFVMHGV